MPKPKFIKPLLIGCACCLPVGLIVGLSVNWEHRQFISSVGSSGVKPFIESFGKYYIESNPKIDVQVESGGTTFAIEQIAKKLTNIGNASNNPYYTINKDGTGYRDLWVNKKTFTLGWEGLVIMYKMPEGLSQQAQEHFDIVITADNILDLYSVFSGFNESLIHGEVYPWRDKQDAQWRGSMMRFMTDESIKYLTEADKEIILNTPIIPFVRSGGNTAANSSIAFTYYSNLANFEDMTENQQHAFAGGQYGTDRVIYETEESNARAWEMFSKLDKPGSMVYLTTGFVKNKTNQDEIKKHGYQIAGYLPYLYSKPVYIEKDGDLAKICQLGGYNWYRPINCMIDLDNQLSKDFIYWIYTTKKSGSKLINEVLDENGAKPLTNSQFISMLDLTKQTLKEQLFSSGASDLELEKDRQQYEKYKYIYGAEDIWE